MKLRMNQQIFVALTAIAFSLLTLFLNACEHSTEPTKLQKDDSLIPTAIGNFWVYVDSIIINDTLEVKTDTAMITGFKIVDGRKWWQLRNNSIAMELLWPEFMVQNDSIYTWEHCRSGQQILGLKFVPPQEETICFDRLLGCDTDLTVKVSMKQEEYRSPLGTFNSYVLYDVNEGPTKNLFFVVPGVGILNNTLEGEIAGRGKFLIKSTLIDYHLEI